MLNQQIKMETKYMKEIVENAKYCHDITNDENERYGIYPNKYSLRKLYKQKAYKFFKNTFAIVGILAVIALLISLIKRRKSE